MKLYVDGDGVKVLEDIRPAKTLGSTIVLAEVEGSVEAWEVLGPKAVSQVVLYYRYTDTPVTSVKLYGENHGYTL